MAEAITGFGNRITVTTTTPAATVTFREIDVTPMGYEGDEQIEQTANDATRFHSFEPGDLVTKTDMEATVYYIITDLAEIKSVVNVKGTVAVAFKDGSSITSTGWIKSFTPDPQSAGDKPKAKVVMSFDGEDSTGTDSDVIVDA